MKIEAAVRLTATKEIEDRTLKTTVGIDGKLVRLDDDEAYYEVTEDSTHAIQVITKRLGRPKEGRKGDTLLYVWENPKYPDIGFVFHVFPKGNPILEIYDR